jgi:hypothetical protein
LPGCKIVREKHFRLVRPLVEANQERPARTPGVRIMASTRISMSHSAATLAHAEW